MKAEVKQNSAAMTVAGGAANVPLVSAEAVRVRKGYSPYIEGGYWYVYDDAARAFVNTGVLAEGKAGADGKDGINGKDGVNGINGKDGQNGADGKDGAQGPQGERGPQGLQGEQGIQGPKGDDGAKGDKGDKGDSYSITAADYDAIAAKVPVPTVPKLYSADGLHTDGAFTQKYVSEALSGKAPNYHLHEKLSIGDNTLKVIDGKGIQYDDGDNYYWLAYKSDIPTDAHINSLIDAKLTGVETLLGGGF